jgi:hypothetical protein
MDRTRRRVRWGFTGKLVVVTRPRDEGDKVGAGTLPLFLGWVLFLVALLVLYMVIGILND